MKYRGTAAWIVRLAALACAAYACGCAKNPRATMTAPTKDSPAAEAAASRPARPMRVLFVGNSYTGVNDLPRMLEQFGQAAGRPIETARCVPGGWTLQKHWDGPARKMIAEGNFDRVVLQEQSQLPIVAPGLMHKYVRLFDAEIRKAGGKTILFETWARKDRPDQQAELTKAYTDIARELGATVAPVGSAWQKALAQRPGLDFYHDDNSHPKPAGSYLAACVFYAVLTGKNPEGLPAKITAEVQAGRSRLKKVLADLPAADAAFLQQIAWQTVGRLTADEAKE